MRIQTARFGTVEIQPDDILFFRHGVFGYENSQHWVLLADADNRSVGWLQCMQRPDVALPVVAPRRFVRDYQVRLEAKDVEQLHLSDVQCAFVLGVVSQDRDVLTLNLRAPVVINLDRRLGCQVITVDPQPVQYELATLPLALRRTA